MLLGKATPHEDNRPFVPVPPHLVRPRSVTDVPQPFEAVFRAVFSPAFSTFNAMQSQLVDKLVLQNDSMALSAPTGTGKTVVFEMAVCSLFAKELEAGSKAVYLAPSKFLVMQKYQEWQDKFGESMRLRMAEVTGDNSMSHTEMAAADIILSTPEKWDSVSRKWNEMEAFVSAIKLLMVDEIHFIADEERGATLEAIVCRMKYISSWNQQQGRAEGCAVRPLRIVGVSASVPNLEDVGRWLGAPPSHICAFGHEFRPVPLFIHTLSGGKFTNEFMFDKGLNTKIPELIRQHSNGRPVLVFCSTRKSTQAAALQLARESAVNLISGAQRLLLHQRAREINNCQDKDLRECLSAGVGFHNGQLCLEDRKVVEKLFLEKALISIYATSTLAVGANLPAFLVIIKSTIQYRRVAGIATWAEYEVHSIQQMAGRAGRPGFDTEGKVIILTQDQNVSKYRNILDVKIELESRLASHLTEHLNSEIVLKSIKDIESMLVWAKSTFFAERAKKVPARYFPMLRGTEVGEASRKVDHLIRDMCLQGYKKLSEATPPLCISKDEDGMTFESTDLGRVMAKYCVAFKTMETMGNLLQPQTTMAEMICCLSEAEEFLDFKPRNDQKKMLETANKTNDAVRFPIQKKVNTGGWTGARKVNLLLQLAIGGGSIEGSHSSFQLRSEIPQICDNAARVCEALVEFAVSMRWFPAAVRAVKLCQSIKGRCWEDDKSGRLLQQLKGLGDAMSKKLVASAPPIVNLKDMRQVSLGRLEVILGKHVGFKLLQELERIPWYHIQAALEDPQPNTVNARIRLTITSTCSPDTPNFPVLLVGRQDGNGALFRHRILSFAQKSTIEVTVQVPQEAYQQQLFIHVMNKNFVGQDGNALVLIPGAVDGKDAGDSTPETAKKRRISTLKAIRSEEVAEQPREHVKQTSSAKSMLEFLGAKAHAEKSQTHSFVAAQEASSKYMESASNRSSIFSQISAIQLEDSPLERKLNSSSMVEDVSELDRLSYDISLRRTQRAKEVMTVINRTFEKAGFREQRKASKNLCPLQPRYGSSPTGRPAVEKGEAHLVTSTVSSCNNFSRKQQSYKPKQGATLRGSVNEISAQKPESYFQQKLPDGGLFARRGAAAFVGRTIGISTSELESPLMRPDGPSQNIRSDMCFMPNTSSWGKRESSGSAVPLDRTNKSSRSTLYESLFAGL